MDLAKIRKKSLQALAQSGDERSVSQAFSLDQIKSSFESVPVAPAPFDAEPVQMESFSAPVVPAAIVQQLFTPVLLDRESSKHNTPLEALLAGRSAAGCDDESILTEDVAGETVTESSLEFLCFRVSDEIYGINIMDIKELIIPREVTEVPRAPLFVSGVLSLRGTIIPVIDMRLRLGLARREPTGKERIIVIKISNSFSGLMVDEVIQVVKVPPDALEAAPAVLDGIDRDFISGLGRSDGRLIIILNLENIADINLY